MKRDELDMRMRITRADLLALEMEYSRARSQLASTRTIRSGSRSAISSQVTDFHDFFSSRPCASIVYNTQRKVRRCDLSSLPRHQYILTKSSKMCFAPAFSIMVWTEPQHAPTKGSSASLRTYIRYQLRRMARAGIGYYCNLPSIEPEDTDGGHVRTLCPALSNLGSVTKVPFDAVDQLPSGVIHIKDGCNVPNLIVKRIKINSIGTVLSELAVRLLEVRLYAVIVKLLAAVGFVLVLDRHDERAFGCGYHRCVVDGAA